MTHRTLGMATLATLIWTASAKQIAAAPVIGMHVITETTPVPLDYGFSNGCGWYYQLVLEETRGVPVTITGYQGRWLDQHGYAVATSNGNCDIENVFLSTRLDAHGTLRQFFLSYFVDQQPVDIPHAQIELTFGGIDDNGVRVIGKGVVTLGRSISDTCPDDYDGDGIPDVEDNCPKNANADQADADNDGYGDMCDTSSENDLDHDHLDDSWENFWWGNTTTVNDPLGDLDGDGLTNIEEEAFRTNPKSVDTNGNGTVDLDDILSCIDPANRSCASDDLCDDGNSCTTDICLGDHCMHNQIDRCCSTATKCPQLDPCRPSICNLTTHVCELGNPTPGCCVTPEGFADTDCDGIPDRTDQCPNTPHTLDNCADEHGCSCGEQECALGKKAALLAKCQVGLPYVFGGKGYDISKNHILAPQELSTTKYRLTTCTPGMCVATSHNTTDSGIDCSGTSYWSYNSAQGITDHPTEKTSLVFYEGAAGQYCHNTEEVAEVDLQPGDLMFFDANQCPAEKRCSAGYEKDCITHVAMYMGGPEPSNVVEAYGYDEGVVVTSKEKRKCHRFGTAANAPCDANFVGFRKPINAKIGAKIIVTGSPVTLIVTDPENYTIDAQTIRATDEEILREVPHVFYYEEADIDGDGELDVIVFAPTLKEGTYTITLVPKLGEDPHAPYTLTVEAGDQILHLADNVPLIGRPDEPYRFTSDGATVTPVAPSSTSTLGATTTITSTSTTTTTTSSCTALVDATCACGTPGHRRYLKCVRKLTKGGTLPAQCVESAFSCAKHSVCGKTGAVTCYRTKKNGTTKCTVKSSVHSCKAPRGGSARIGNGTSCCES